MKKIFWMAAIVLASSIPAQAQFGGFAGGSIGKVNFPTLPSVSPTVFKASTVSGSQIDFMPSTFVLFSDALLEGKNMLAATPKTLGEVAAEYRQTARPKAKFVLTQDAYGYPVIESE